MKKIDNYYFGADLGTDSIGWAATDIDYNILRLKGKHAWGANIFDQATDCQKRRAFRSNRRRMARRKYRLELLNQLFAEELAKVDSTFLIRLNNSTYVYEDKLVKGLSRTLLFNSLEEEKQFYKDYPTIWHLRNDLVNNKENSLRDLKKVYLAIHHIMKYRGNFIKEGQTLNLEVFDTSNFSALNELLKSLVTGDDEIDGDYLKEESYNSIIKVLEDKTTNKRTKQSEIEKLFENVDSDDIKRYVKLFVTLVTGGSIGSDKIIPEIAKEDKKTIEFGPSYDELEGEYKTILGDAFEIVEIAKQVYDYISLKGLLKGNKYLSNAMSGYYEDHKKDLKILKEVLIDIDNKRGLKGKDREYYKVFKDNDSEKNYAAFTHNNSNKGRPSPHVFNSFVKEILLANKELINEDSYNYLMSKIEDDSLLLIIANVSTSTIPHQVHLLELEEIINNAAVYHPFLKDIKEKLIKLFKFRVPYYYGPLDTRSKFAWVERKDNSVNVTPWNIDEIIDKDETKKKFIRRLTNKCTYLHYEDVLPKASMIYEGYLILSRLNTLKINGNALTQEMKDKAFDYISLRPKTTISNLEGFFKKAFAETFANDQVIITGLDINVPFTSESKAFMSRFFDLNDSKEFDEAEEIIFLATVYADSKSMLEEALKQLHASNDLVKAIKGFRAKKWGQFSKKLLCGIRAVDDNGVTHSIMDLLKSTNKNFQQILEDSEYGFRDIIKEENDRVSGNYSKKQKIEEILENTPPKHRRSIYRFLAVLDDVVKITKKAPEKIFLEVTRENLDEKQKKAATKDSRYVELEKFLNAIKKDAKNARMSEQADHMLKTLEDYSSDENMLKLRGKHLYLYFKQLGFDLYTGNQIEINDVLTSDRYDIDHIIPQSLRKDDSLDNMVLVDRQYNQKIKRDIFPIPHEIKTPNVLALWKYLYEHNAISKKKYTNLKRSEPLTLDEIQDFVASQINVVNYANVAIRDILNVLHPETKVVFSKAQYPSMLRRVLRIAKNRDLNDAHHAVDAYLNVVAGNILSTVFSNVRRIYAEKVQEHKSDRSFEMNKVLLSYLMSKDGVLTELGQKVVETCLRHDALVTYRVNYYSGRFYKETIYGAGDGDNILIPRHTSEDSPLKDTSKYGGFTYLQNDFLLFAEVTEKGKTRRRFLRSKYLYSSLYSKEQWLDKVIEENGISKDASVRLLKKVYIGQKVSYKGTIATLTTYGDPLNLKLAYQNYIENEHLLYLSFCNKKIELLDSDANEITVSTPRRDKDTNAEENSVIVSKGKNLKIMKSILENAQKDIYGNVPFIKKFKEIDLEKFMTFTLKNQILIINEAIVLFTRNAKDSSINKIENFCDIKTKYYLLTMNTDFSESNLCIIYESPTGLFSKKVRL